MAPALTAEPLSTKEKLTSAASPSVVVKKPATPTPATATTRVTRSSKEAAAAATAASKAAAAVVPQRVPSSRISNNKRKLSGGNNSSNKQQNNDPMGLSTAPTPHTTTTTTTSTGSVVAEAEAATGASVPPISDADVASTSATVLLESESPAPQESDSPPSTDVPPAAATIEHNNNNSSGSRPSKDNSTAQLLADLNSDFVETISAGICLRKTLPEVSLSKEPAPSAVALTGAETAVEVAETVAEVEVEVETEAVTGESTTGVPEPETQIDLIQSMELEQPATTTASVEELPKIDADNIEERLSQLDGNASTILVELPSVQLDHEQGQVQVEVVIPATPTTPSRQQVQQDPRSEPLPGILASPLPGQRHSTAASALNASQLTPQSTSSSTNFLKDATAGVVLEDPDIEEVLKALKTFEGNHVINPDINPDMCDFNFFSEVWEEPPQATAVTHRSFTPQYTQNPIGGHSGVITSHVPTADSMAECQKSIEQQQQMLTRKMEHLFRRMRKLQARQMCSHTSEEVVGIMEWAARISHKTPNPVRSDTLSEQETTVQSIVSGRPRPDFWEHQTKHPVPANQLASILRSIATAARHQQICHTPSGGSATLAPSSTWYNSASCAAAVPAKARRGKNQLDTSAGAASTSMAAAAVIEQKTPGLHEIIPCFDTHITNELTHVSGLLHNEMREIQNAIDSDATESSSGGESADEMVTYNNNEQKSLTIARRAVWTYSKDRANIALRWSWLCSQMADLEGRKRQYREMYIDLTQAKGAVELEPMQVQQPANGYKEEPSSEWQCSRARPLMLSKFRKRSLFQTTGIHTISKKAARPSNIKCGCQWPQIPCALCTGRPDPTAPRELAEMMMPANRVALLDPGYHPVLSFDTDVTQSVHFEAVSRQGDWQQRVSRCQAKTVVKGVHRAEREAIAASNSAARRPGDLIKRRYIRRKERNNNNNNNNNSNSNKDATTTAAAATGLGDSGNASRRQQTQPPTGMNASSISWPDSRQRQRQRHLSPSSAATAPQISNSDAKRRRTSTKNSSSNSNSNAPNNSHLNGYSDQSGVGVGGDLRNSSRSRHASPTHNQRTERTTERRHRPVYDIDNIVIPYSIAAQTKVEILPYKEIPTPKWRVVDSETDNTTPAEPAASSTDDSTAAPAPAAAPAEAPPLPTQTEIKSGGNGIVPAVAAAAGITLNEQKPQALSVPGQPSKVNGLKKLQQNTKHNINNNNNNNNGLVNGNIRKEKAEACEQKNVPPQLQVKEKEKAVLQVLAVQAEANVRNEDILSAVGLENDIQSSFMTNKKDIQPTASDLKDIPSTLSDQKDIQSSASDKKDIQSSTSDQNDNQPSTSNYKDILQSKASRKKSARAKRKCLKKKKHRPNGKIAKATATVTKEEAATETAAAAGATRAEEKSRPHLIEGVRIATVEPMAKRPKLQLAKGGEGDKPKTNGGQSIAPIVQLDPEEDDEDEDTSDEAYAGRHHLAQIEERQRFETYLKFPWSTRPRANRRVDSRAESSGANTPDSASPAPHLAGGGSAGGLGDNESIPSPLAHPLEGFNDNGEMVATTVRPQARRRTTSSKLKDQMERRSATPDIKDTFVEPSPFEPLTFPLSEDVYQKMLSERYAPPKHEVLKPEAKRTKSKSTSSNGDGGSASAGKSKRRSSKTKTKLVNGQFNGQLNGHQTADAADAAASTATATAAKINGGMDEEVEDDMEDGVDYDPDPEDMLMEELEEDYPKHHLAPLDDDEMHGDDDLYNSAIDAYLGDQEALEEDMADDPFGDDDPNDPEWKTRSDGSRKRL